MSAIGECCNPCPPLVVPTQVPGAAGKNGQNGNNGVNSYSTIASFQGIGFVVPAIGSSATVYVTDTGTWMGLGQPVFITGAGQYIVTAEASANSNGTFVQLENTGQEGNAVPGSSISSGNMISPSGLQGINSFTTTTAPYTTPAVGYAATITVANSSWMIVGETVFIQGGGYFTVVTVNVTNNTALLSNPGFANTTAGANIPTGNGVGPSGTQGSLPLPPSQTFYIAGQSINLGNTMANIGTAIVTLPAAGTWALYARIQTSVSNQASGINAAISSELQAQAAGAGPLSVLPDSVTSALLIGSSTGVISYGHTTPLPVTIYQTSTANDKIYVYAEYTVNSSNNIQVTEISLVAVCINLQT